jgi:hypothetical protein
MFKNDDTLKKLIIKIVCLSVAHTVLKQKNLRLDIYWNLNV